MQNTAIEAINLTKRYNKLLAIDNISFNIPKGSIVGILGSNGAGKTTLIKSLIGITKPNHGTISLLGYDLMKNMSYVRDLIGYMPQDPSLYDDLTVEENISFFGKAKSKYFSRDNLEEVLESTELKYRRKSKVGNLSGGLKKRVSLACCSVNKPQILFLDEPTAAIDPILKVKTWKIFREFVANGKTIVISTHLMDEAILCDYLLILKDGKLLMYDTPDNIIKGGKATIYVNKDNVETVQNTPESIADTLHKFGLNNDIHSVQISNQNIEDIMIELIESKNI